MRAMTIPAHTRPIHTIRWANFRWLLETREMTITAVADKLGKPQGQVSHFGGKRPTKVIGDQIAAEVEAAFRLPAGWMDLNHSGSELEVKSANSHGPDMITTSHFEEADPAIVAQAEHWVRFEEEARRQQQLAPWGPEDGLQAVRRAARLIALTQLLQARGGRLDPAEAAKLIDAARQKGESDVSTARGRKR